MFSNNEMKCHDVTGRTALRLLREKFTFSLSLFFWVPKNCNHEYFAGKW